MGLGERVDLNVERAHVKVRAGTQEHFERGCGESFWRTTYYREEMIVNDMPSRAMLNQRFHHKLAEGTM